MYVCMYVCMLVPVLDIIYELMLSTNFSGSKRVTPHDTSTNAGGRAKSANRPSALCRKAEGLPLSCHTATVFFKSQSKAIQVSDSLLRFYKYMQGSQSKAAVILSFSLLFEASKAELPIISSVLARGHGSPSAARPGCRPLQIGSLVTQMIQSDWDSSAHRSQVAEQNIAVGPEW